MCLEEMFSTRIEEGAIFYGETRRREQVYFSSELREEVENIYKDSEDGQDEPKSDDIEEEEQIENVVLEARFTAHRIKEILDKRIYGI